MTDKKRKSLSQEESGFVLLDVVFALFLFTLGFTSLYGLTEGAIHETQQALNFTEAANLAQNLMEDLSAHPWSDNFARQRCVPGASVDGSKGRFQWSITSDWQDPDQVDELLKVQIKVSWQENGKEKSYTLDTLFSTN